MTCDDERIASEELRSGALLTVRNIVLETNDARTFEFDVPDELAQVYRGCAGQFLRVTIPGDPTVLSRCYSLSNAPELREPLRFTVKRVPGGRVSERLVGWFEGGQSLRVEPPAGVFTLKDTVLPLVLIAGGSGITPVFSLLKAALNTTHRQVTLLYANRTRREVIFAEEIEHIARRFADRLVVTHHYSDEEGFIDEGFVRQFVSPLPQSQIYLCGPQPLMDVVENALGEPALTLHELFLEKFGGSSPAVKAGPARLPASVVSSVNVTLHLDGAKLDFAWTGSGTLLDAALAANIPAPHSCREGHCGACKARLTDGKVTQSPTAIALSKRDRSRGNILPCCAMPASDTIVLEYD